jgi:hypothetical protein
VVTPRKYGIGSTSVSPPPEHLPDRYRHTRWDLLSPSQSLSDSGYSPVGGHGGSALADIDSL